MLDFTKIAQNLFDLLKKMAERDFYPISHWSDLIHFWFK